MGRPRSELQTLLAGIPNVVKAYFQPPTTIPKYPVIIYERDDTYVARADNLLYWGKKRYTVTVIDRDPDSIIPDFVEALPYSRINRKFSTDGLNHTVFQLYF